MEETPTIMMTDDNGVKDSLKTYYKSQVFPNRGEGRGVGVGVLAAHVRLLNTQQ